MSFSPNSLTMKYRSCAKSAILTVILKVVGIYAQDLLLMKMLAHVAECEYKFRSLKVLQKRLSIIYRQQYFYVLYRMYCNGNRERTAGMDLFNQPKNQPVHILSKKGRWR